jgi:virulence factor Mce-like protein
LGLLLVVVIAGFFVVTVMMYNQAFTPVASVSLNTDHAGNEMSSGADVKVRGMVVGTVRSVNSTGNGAVLDLAIQPDLVSQIPANVSAVLLPKTLFGEKYVDLEIPTSPTGQLAAGDTITQTSTGMEVQQVIDDLMPVLQAVQPQKLSVTLTAISTALRGKGTELGQTLASLGQYVGQLNPQLPTLEHDLTALAATADTYNIAAPKLINALSDLSVTSQTLVDQQNNLQTLYSTLSTASNDLDNFLRANANDIIGLSSSSMPTLDTLARYSPEYPCFLKQMAKLVPTLDTVFGKGTSHPGLHASIDITINRGKYVSGTDTPAFNENRGPRCYALNPQPNPFPQYAPDGPLQDGSTHPPAAKTSSTGLVPQSSQASTSALTTPTLPNSAVENGFLAELVGPSIGVNPQYMPTWSSLLIGPLFRGAEVTVK